MKHTKNHIYENLDALIDGELSRSQLRIVHKHLKECESCRRKMEEHKKLSHQLRTLPLQPCPERIIQRVLLKTNLADQKEERRFSFPFQHHKYKWRLATGLTIAAVAVLILILWPKVRQDSPFQNQYSQEEIAQAKKDVELALGYVIEIRDRAQKILSEKIAAELMTKPLKKGLLIAVESLQNNGGKR